MSDFESGVGEWQVILRVGWGGECIPESRVGGSK